MTTPVAVRFMILFALASIVAEAGEHGASRVTPDLMALHAEHAAHGGGSTFHSSNRLARVIDDRVVIDAVAEGAVDALEADLRALGMQRLSVFGRVISGEIPIHNIQALQGIAGLRFARAAYAIRRVGLTTSQGDQAMRSDVARSSFGVTGVGVTVGVLSDSFNCLGGASDDVSNGDLSPVAVVKDVSSCQDATDEGRAMLQIVHDVAPGAGLAFATAIGGQAAFANNILALQASGARVIVDDVSYLTEPMFQDGIIAQAVDTVVARGSAYFSAAGNEARRSYESAFRAGASFAIDQFPSALGAPRFFGGVAHNFATSGATPHFQRITIPALAQLIISFQWDSPFFSVSGPPGSPNDVDIYLFNTAGDRVVAGSVFDNSGNDAVELFTFSNSGPTADFNLMIVSASGPLPGFIKYIQLGRSSITIKDFNSSSSTIFGHPNAAGATAVGAAFFLNTPAFGVSPPMLESSSSAGGTPIFFDAAGRRLATPLIRQKPEIVAPDGGNTTFFPPGPDNDIPQDPDTFPNFVGTSAAAPHAAGVAALMLEKQPSLAPGGISFVLKRGAIDMKTPGFDFDSGFGLVQADAAVGALPVVPMAAAILPSSRSVQVGAIATVFATVINDGATTASGVSVAPATSIPGSFTYQTTDPATNQPTGTPNSSVDIAPGAAQTFVLSFAPSAPISATDVSFNFAGSNTVPVTPIAGVNTLLLSASPAPVPDIVALAATPSGDLITNIPGPTGTGAFSVASVNVGATASITATADTGGAALPLSVFLCQTNPMTAQCLAPPASSVTTTIDAGGTPTFSVFVVGSGSVPFNPATNRIFVRFKDAGQTTRGSTSTAVRTQ
jgi:hypothetical protein